jgi:NDP-sugar pyrophosphorylase family protein
MHISQLKPDIFFAFEYYPYRDLFHDCIYVWDALKDLPSYIQSVLKPKIHGKVAKLAHVEGPVFIGKGTTVESGAMIKGPAIIGNGCEIRAGAYIRENTLIADGVVIGHASEVKHSILFNQVSVPHFAFVGDSILGQKVHLGAGVRLSNFKITGRPVRFSMEMTLWIPDYSNLDPFWEMVWQ